MGRTTNLRETFHELSNCVGGIQVTRINQDPSPNEMTKGAENVYAWETQDKRRWLAISGVLSRPRFPLTYHQVASPQRVSYVTRDLSNIFTVHI